MAGGAAGMRKLWPLASILYAFVVMLLPRLQPDIAPVLHSETELIESFGKAFTENGAAGQSCCGIHSLEY